MNKNKKTKIYLSLLFFITITFLILCYKTNENYIKIAFIGPLKTFAGVSMKNAALIAINEINEAGGISIKQKAKNTKYKIKPVFINDYYTNVAKASLELRKVIEEENVQYIIGGFFSKTVLPLMEIMAEKKILWLGTGGASSKIIDKIKNNYDRYKYYFRVGVLDSSHHAKAIMKFAKEQLFINGKRNIYVITVNHSLAKLISNQTKNLLTLAGFKIIDYDVISADTKKFNKYLNKIKRAQGILCVFLSDEAEAFIKFAGEKNINKSKPVFGIITHSFKNIFYQKTNGGALWVTSHQSNGGPVDKTGNGLVKHFRKKYLNKYKTKPYWLSAAVYDAFYIFKKAVEKTNSLDNTKIIKTMESKDFEYIGMMRLKWHKKSHDLFTGEHDGIMYAYGTFFQFFPDGKRYPVYPKFFKTKNYHLPGKVN